MIEHLPHEPYISLLIARGMEDWEVEDELSILRLPSPNEKLLKHLRKTTPISKAKRFRVTSALKRWADRRNIDHAVLNTKCQRVQSARMICFHSTIRHAIELCLLNSKMSWSEIVSNLSRLGKPRGLASQMVKDYHLLFWNFNLLSLQEKESYFRRIRATAGMQAAANGYPQMGLSMDFGVPVEMDAGERLQYLMEITYSRAEKDIHTGASAIDSRNWIMACIALEREVQRFAPAEMEARVVYDSGTIDMIPDVDHLDYSEEYGAKQLTEEGDDPTDKLVPFVPRK